MIKKLDLYIIKKFLGSFIFVMLLINAISIVIDISEKIDDFIEHEAPLKAIVFDYYINFIPHMTSLLGPFFVLITVIFFTSQMAYKSEIVAILSSGISYNRMLYPYMLAATLLAGVLYFGNNIFVPKANENRLAFENTYVTVSKFGWKRNLHRQIEPGVFIYMESFNTKDTTGNKFSLERISDGELEYKLRSKKIRWDAEKNLWKIENYIIREFKDGREYVKTGKKLEMELAMLPEDFTKKMSVKEEMTTKELNVFIQKLKDAGVDNVEFYEIEKHRRTSAAFSVYLLTLIGVTIASRKVRGGMGLHIVFGITLSALYEVIMKFSTTFSTNADLPPEIGVWIPNALYAILAIVLLRTTPK